MRIIEARLGEFYRFLYGFPRWAFNKSLFGLFVCDLFIYWPPLVVFVYVCVCVCGGQL
jgi:hypothetical protein